MASPLEVYQDRTKDPNDIDVFEADWATWLGEGETVASIVSVALVAAAGTSITAQSNTTTVTRITLSGGTHLARAIWTVLILTSAARRLERSFAVDVVDSTYVEPAETGVVRLARQIAEAKAQRHKVALGEAVVELSRDGRRVIRKLGSMAELENYIRVLESELVAAQGLAGVPSVRRRTAMGTGYY